MKYAVGMNKNTELKKQSLRNSNVFSLSNKNSKQVRHVWTL